MVSGFLVHHWVVLQKERGERKQLQHQGLKDEIARIPVESKFGNGKRRYNLDCIKEKRQDASETTIGVVVLVMILEKIMSDFLFVFFVLHKQTGSVSEQRSFTKDIHPKDNSPVEYMDSKYSALNDCEALIPLAE
jgi:hypothetical protein